MNILEDIKKLNLPEGKYVIIAAGILDVLGIRKTNDIDIAVTKDLYEDLRKQDGWEEHRGNYTGGELQRGDVSIFSSVEDENYPRTVEQVIASAETIEGVPFMNLRELIAFKTALGREKDREDIKRIVMYISEQNNNGE